MVDPGTGTKEVGLVTGIQEVGPATGEALEVGFGLNYTKTGTPEVDWRPYYSVEETQEVCCGSSHDDDGSLDVGLEPSHIGVATLDCSPVPSCRRDGTPGGSPGPAGI